MSRARADHLVIITCEGVTKNAIAFDLVTLDQRFAYEGRIGGLNTQLPRIKFKKVQSQKAFSNMTAL
jgi:hypothetical protein